jgi:hypothetical protein
MRYCTATTRASNAFMHKVSTPGVAAVLASGDRKKMRPVVSLPQSEILRALPLPSITRLEIGRDNPGRR